MAMNYTIDDDRRLLTITLSGTVAGREFARFARDLYDSRPELFDYDCISDLLAFEGDVASADLDLVHELYAAQPERSGPARPGVFVTLDSNFHLWASALDAQFPGRKHYVATSLEGAFLRLDMHGQAAGTQR